MTDSLPSTTNYPLLKALCAVAQKRGAKLQYAWLVAAMTPKEVENLERRLEVARLLEAGASYTEIQKELQVSAATVALVSQLLTDSSDFRDLVAYVGKEQRRWWQARG